MDGHKDGAEGLDEGGLEFGRGQTLYVSVFKSADGAALAKVRGLNADGTLRKRTSPSLADGSVEVRRFASIRDVAQFAASLSPKQALGFGRCGSDATRVVTEAARQQQKGEDIVSRTKAFFHFAPEPGVLHIDYDPLPGRRPLSTEQLAEVLRAAVPELRQVAFAAKPSSSAYLHAPDGSELVGAAGLHLFIPVADASQIIAFGQIIVDRLWLAGHGTIKITGNGARKFATVIDGSVWSPERLCFGRASCTDGVEQRFPEIAYFPPQQSDPDGGERWLAALVPLTDIERQERDSLQVTAYAAAGPEAERIRQEWAGTQADKCVDLAAQRGLAVDREKMIQNLLATEGQVLPAELVLYPEHGEPVTVAEVYADSAKWKGKRFADPFEPDYGGDNRIAVAMFDCAEPHIFSHAHGGQKYAFRSESQRHADYADGFDYIPSGHRFEALPAGVFAQGETPQWFVKGVLPKAALGVIYGASGSGKTFFAFDLVASIALGTNWKSHRVMQGTVVYICAEGIAGFRKRITAYEKHKIIKLESSLRVIAGQPDLLVQTDLDELLVELKSVSPAIIVIDTLAQVMPGADENNSVDMGEALKQCRRINEETGATVLLIHHAGKDATRGARGWSGLRAAADVEIEVSSNGCERAARITKMKDGEDGAIYAFRLLPVWLGEDDDGDPVTSCVLDHVANQPLSTLRREAPKGANQLAVYTAVQECMSLGGDGVAIGDVLAKAAAKKVYDPGPDQNNPRRDQRRQHMLRAIDQLVGRGILVNDNSMISIAASTASNEAI